MANLDEVKERLAAEVDRRADVLIDASRQIHAHPELGFEEQFAHDLLTELLDKEGLDVEPHAYGLDTAFVARAGHEGPTIAICCEYDALPGIGHGCGHNIIATAGLGAGLAAAALANELGGRVVVLGTPAEEGGGGKVLMDDNGALEGIDAAMMVHPAGAELSGMRAIAVHQVIVDYQGEAAHAAAFPQKGRNALDAAVLGYMNVAALRQHIRPDERIHGIFLEAGDRPNIVPDHASAHWYVRSPTMRTLEPLKERVLACLEAGAAAAGCTMSHRWHYPPYADIVHNGPMVESYRRNAGRVGRTVIDGAADSQIVGSTDMGNVSYRVPSIHPIIKVSPPTVAIHTTEFAQWAASSEGDQAVIDGAKIMAMTVADLWLAPDLLGEAKQAFAATVGRTASRDRSTEAPAPPE